MEKNPAVRNQKVFVTLDKVVELQTAYLRSKEERKALSSFDSVARRAQVLTRNQVLEQVINLLDLPLPL